jgi:hypothetical protein
MALQVAGEIGVFSFLRDEHPEHFNNYYSLLLSVANRE